MDTAISIIVLISVIVSLISGFTKKKPVQEQRQKDHSGPFANQSPQRMSPTSSIRESEEKDRVQRANREGSSFSGEGFSAEQEQITFDKVSSTNISASSIRNIMEREEESEPVIAIKELFEHDSLVKGVIVAEVLGKPKAMR